MFKGVINMDIVTLFKNSKHTDVEKFADYLLNKIKRDDTGVWLRNGYLMDGYRCFIINNSFYKRKEARAIIIDNLKVQ